MGGAFGCMGGWEWGWGLVWLGEIWFVFSGGGGGGALWNRAGGGIWLVFFFSFFFGLGGGFSVGVRVRGCVGWGCEGVMSGGFYELDDGYQNVNSGNHATTARIPDSHYPYRAI